MMNCGLLGRQLGHSYSPTIHGMLGDYPYNLYQIEPENLADFLQNGSFTGLNVTIPYKRTVMDYCQHLTECAKKIGAVNTLVRQCDGSLLGHNTDYFGFVKMLERSKLQVAGKKVLVLGSGGASATVVAVLRKQSAEPIVISRAGENNYQNLHIHKDASVIVNTTPVGMYPNCGISPIDLSIFPNLEGVLDVIYNPASTKLVLDAKKRGLKTENGLIMLVAQAWEAAQCFTGTSLPESLIDTIWHKLRAQMENLILIGMPGCGKTTVGKLLAEHTGKPFVDTDTVIEAAAGCSIPEIFAKFGQDYFRQLESNVLARVGMGSGQIIATGGGCVTRPENYDHLHQNGNLVWLERDVNHLPKDGRPLSQTGSLTQMYEERKPLYRHFANYTIPNNTTPEQCVEKILKWEGSL